MRIAIALAALALSACATAPDAAPAPEGPARFVMPEGTPASPEVRFYADCIAQSAAAGAFDRENGLIRFTCAGTPAQAFFDGLAAWSAATGSEQVAAGRTWRSTQKVTKDLSGIDFCWRSMEGDAAYGCTLVFNAGNFIRPPVSPAAPGSAPPH